MSIMRSTEHAKAIALAKITQGYTCEICESELNIQGHHILDYSLGGKATVENILVVCKKCHDDVHNGKIKIHTYDYRS